MHTHTHVHTHTHIRREVPRASRWLTRAGMVGYSSSLLILFPPLLLCLQLLSFSSSRKQSNTHTHTHTHTHTLHRAIHLSLSISTVAHKHECTCFKKKKTWPPIRFVFIRPRQTGLKLNRRNNIPACCVKLYELMKSAGPAGEGFSVGKHSASGTVHRLASAVFSGYLSLT